MSELINASDMDSLALVTDDATITYAQLAGQSDALAARLFGLSIGVGDRVAFMAPNSILAVCCYLACAKAGFIAVPLSIRASVEELQFQVTDAAPRVLIHHPQFTETVESVVARVDRAPSLLEISDADLWSIGSRTEGVPPVATTGNDVFSIMYTGGTTGVAKAAVQSHAAWTSTIRNVVSTWELTANDRHVCVLPMSHVAWFTVAAHLSVGAPSWLSSRWDPKALLDLVAAEGITTLNLIPTMLNDIVVEATARPRDISSLRLLTVAGSPMPPELYARAERTFGPIIGNIYGLTETSGPVTFLMPQELASGRVNSAGRPGHGVEVSIFRSPESPAAEASEGEILLRGPQVIAEYLNRPDETELALRDGWFHTGDVGRFDDEGFLYILDRSKDMIKSGGFNVYPKEIEDVLYSHPAVLEAAVIGAPDPKWMESAVAYVALREDASVTEETLQEHCRAKLANYKVPKTIEFAKSIPRTSVGKFDKKALREALLVRTKGESGSGHHANRVED
jgi:long-chain acyl-CoA synthetase